MTRSILTALLLASGMNSVLAQTDLPACAAIADSAERLSCYDAALENRSKLPVVRLPRSTGVEQADDAGNAAEAVGSVSPAPEDSFGLEGDSGSRTMTVASARHNDLTGWTIEFENGQVWRQIGADYYPIKVGDSYTIRSAAFDSFLLSNSENNNQMRVTRLR